MKVFSALVLAILLFGTFGPITMTEAKVWECFEVTERNIISPVRVPGVKAGDYAKYSVGINYSSNDPYFPSSGLDGAIQVEYEMVEIVSVVNSSVKFEVAVHLRNGTDLGPTMETIDVYSGSMTVENFTFTSFTGPLIGANLTAGDIIYMNPPFATINSTKMGEFAGANRRVNVFEARQEYLGSSMYTDLLWDRISGLIVASNQSTQSIRENYTTKMDLSMLIEETNVWQPTIQVENVRVLICPPIINVRSNGRFITALIELPESCRLRDVDISTIKLNGTIAIQDKPLVLGKHWLLVKFNRDQVIDIILKSTHTRLGFARTQLTITGEFSDGRTFQGTDTVFVLLPHGGHFPVCEKWVPFIEAR